MFGCSSNEWCRAKPPLSTVGVQHTRSGPIPAFWHMMVSACADCCKMKGSGGGWRREAGRWWRFTRNRKVYDNNLSHIFLRCSSVCRLSMRLSVALCPPFLTVFLRFFVFRFCFRVCSDFVVRVVCPCCSVLCHHAENEVLFKLHVQVTRDERGAHFDGQVLCCRTITKKNGIFVVEEECCVVSCLHVPCFCVIVRRVFVYSVLC